MNSILSLWNFNIAAACGIGLTGLAILRYHKFRGGPFFGPLLLAFLLSVACFFSPLQVLSQQYLFSAHMVVHVLLLLVIAPLLVLALHNNNSPGFVQNLSGLLSEKPWIGWAAGVGIMWFWHVPVIFNTSMHIAHGTGIRSLLINSIETCSLLVAGMLFSWPLIAPPAQHRLPALTGVVYLFTACIGCSLLGLLITFAPAGMYRHYLSALDPFNLNELIINQWQINQVNDQQIAGLIMWVPCCLLYVVYALYLLISWFNTDAAIVGDQRG